MVLGTALAGRAPISVSQMLLVNMFTSMFPALAVAVDTGEDRSRSTETPSAALGATLARAVVIRGTATALGATLAWTVGRYTGRARRAGSMGLAALIGTQLLQTLATGWRSPLVVATTLASAAALVAVIELPGISHFFGCTPIGPVAWAVVVASATAATLLALLAPQLIVKTPPAQKAAAPAS